MRFTVAGAKYLFFREVNHSASLGRYGTEPSDGSVPSKYFALAVPTDFRLSVGSGMVMTAPALISFSPFFLAALLLGSARRSTSVIVAAAVGIMAALATPSRSVCRCPKNAAMPQKSFCDHLSTCGWTWHSAH